MLSTSFTRVLPMLAASNLFFWTFYRSSGIITWIDVGWVFNHVLVGVYHCYVNNAHTTLEGKFFLGLLFVWGIRLGGYIYKRIQVGHSDPRYDLIPDRMKVGKKVNTYIQFQLQAFLATITAIPLFFLFRNLPGASSLSLETLKTVASDWKIVLGVGLSTMGIIGEAIADTQLETFKKTAQKQEGKDKPLCHVGVWKYARHPNLFFELCFWTGLSVLGMRKLEPQSFLTLVGPAFLYVVMNFLSTRITEKHMSNSRPNWNDHKSKTNKFFPFFKI